ncbi:MAG TPA: diacylglycerol kinase family protein [Solirubrobacterales bacterium]|nr:diacylglycerol kinase family protein [Solirubrobacterales bacterium]
MTQRRGAAVSALVVGTLTLLLALDIVLEQFPRGLVVLGCVAIGLAAAWYGLLRRGAPRVAGIGVALLALAAVPLILILDGDHVVEAVLIGLGIVATPAAARAAFRHRVPLPPADRPEHPVLFYNPKSGGGKAERFSLDAEARSRGIEPIELTQGTDLRELVRGAVARGADGLAMAGGDGSQAIVAEIASEQGLPYACIPAGTRNHFALDLGVDRDDVVGALDAFVDGGEHRVDLGEVNGRVFVNNVSLGLYADAVQRPGYREAKLRTLLDTVPELLGPEGSGLDLSWRGPGGHEHRSGAAVLVSNNRYRLGKAVGSGTRPRIDDGLLGITVASAPTGRGQGRLLQRPWREWSAREFEVDAEHPVAAGIDGEAVTLEPPLRFRIRPGVLCVRIARQHPGASPSAAVPENGWEGLRELARIAAGRTTTTKEG